MNKTRLAWSVVIIAAIILIIAALPGIIHAATIVKSKSNVANNRLMVISTTVGQPAAPDGGHVLLLDTDSGEIWDYSYKSLTGTALPKYVSTLQNLGDSVLVEQKYKPRPD
jgi:hypothetical protein